MSYNDEKFQRFLITEFNSELKKIMSLSENQVSLFGRNELNSFIEYFGYTKWKIDKKFLPIIDSDLTRKEWNSLKYIIKSNHNNEMKI